MVPSLRTKKVYEAEKSAESWQGRCLSSWAQVNLRSAFSEAQQVLCGGGDWGHDFMECHEYCNNNENKILKLTEERKESA